MRHSTSSYSTELLSFVPILIFSAATNSTRGTLVRRIRSFSVWPSRKGSYPPAMKTLRNRFRRVTSRARSRVKYIRCLTNAASPAASAASNSARLARLMHAHRGANNFSSRGYGRRRSAVGKVWVVRRWQGIKYSRMSLASVRIPK